MVFLQRILDQDVPEGAALLSSKIQKLTAGQGPTPKDEKV
jgi:hypothetical protein